VYLYVFSRYVHKPCTVALFEPQLHTVLDLGEHAEELITKFTHATQVTLPVRQLRAEWVPIWQERCSPVVQQCAADQVSQSALNTQMWPRCESTAHPRAAQICSPDASGKLA
jgi:hypothetical protein